MCSKNIWVYVLWCTRTLVLQYYCELCAWIRAPSTSVYIILLSGLEIDWPTWGELKRVTYPRRVAGFRYGNKRWPGKSWCRTVWPFGGPGFWPSGCRRDRIRRRCSPVLEGLGHTLCSWACLKICKPIFKDIKLKLKLFLNRCREAFVQ